MMLTFLMFEIIFFEFAGHFKTKGVYNSNKLFNLWENIIYCFIILLNIFLCIYHSLFSQLHYLCHLVICDTICHNYMITNFFYHKLFELFTIVINLILPYLTFAVSSEHCQNFAIFFFEDIFLVSQYFDILRQFPKFVVFWNFKTYSRWKSKANDKTKFEFEFFFF